MSRFPYAIVYREITLDEIEIVAVAHFNVQSTGHRAELLPNWVLNADETLASLGLSRATVTLLRWPDPKTRARVVPLSEPKPRILFSIPMFDLGAELLSTLREQRRVRATDDIMDAHDAFMLDPGLGPPVYLSSDGRVLWDDDGWGVLGTRAEAFAAIVAGVEKTGIRELLTLLSSRTPDSADCPECRTTGWFDAHGHLKDVHGRSFSVVCMNCAGLGWTAPPILLKESVLEPGQVDTALRPR